MNKKFQQCIGLAMEHTYFVNSDCKVLSLVPINETQRKMKQLDLLLHQVDNVFSLYSAYDADDGFSWKELLKVVDELYFFVINSDPNFLNYTDIPLVIDDKTYYFTNTTGSTVMQKKKLVSGADRVNQTDLIFNIPIPKKAAVNISVTDSYGATVIKATVDGTQQFTYIVDLSPFGSGFYTLYIDGQLNETFVAVSDRVPFNCFGVLRFDLKAISKKQSTSLPVNYTLNFAARATTWIFQIVVTPNKKINVQSMTIENKDGYKYSGPVLQPIVGGNIANVFTSKKPIPLQERYANAQTLKIIYNNEFSSRKNEMDVPMSFPAVNSIQMTDKKPATYASTQIIYV